MQQPHRNNTHATTAQATAGGSTHFKCLAIHTPKPFVFHVELNRPKKLNALSREMWM